MGLAWVRKPSAAFALLSSAAGVPYVLQQTDVGPAVSSLIRSVTAAADNASRAVQGGGGDFGLQSVESVSAAATGGGSGSLSSPGATGNGRTQSAFPPANGGSTTNVPTGHLTSSSPAHSSATHLPPAHTAAGQQVAMQPTGTDTLGPWAMAASGAAMTAGSPAPVPQAPTPTPAPHSSPPPPAPSSWLPQLPQVIRFDINSRWVSQAFPRVQLVHSLADYDGYQVDIDTGNTPYDIHGQLTYFFDSYDQLRRITFSGKCGDPWLVVSTLAQHYRLQPEPALGGQLYLTRWNGQVTNLLLIKPSSVLLAEDQRTRYQLLLEINRPAMPLRMSDEAMAIIEQAAGRGRW